MMLNNQRTIVDYGNGIKTTYEYEETTLRALTIKSSKNAEAAKQDLSYTYDPVGNVTSLIDSSFGTVYHDNQKVDPILKYSYNPIYQLTEAKGRQHLGVSSSISERSKVMRFFKCPLPSINDSEKLENYTEYYKYDIAGNLILRKRISVTSRYTKEFEVELDSNRLKGIEYDASGNMETTG